MKTSFFYVIRALIQSKHTVGTCNFYYFICTPLFILLLSEWMFIDFQLSTVGLLIVHCVPILLTLVENDTFPIYNGSNYKWNVSLLALSSIIFGQLFSVTYPPTLPLFQNESTPWLIGLSRSDFHAGITMIQYHGAFVFFGFMLISFEKKLPFVPTRSPLFIVLLSLNYLIFISLGYSPSADFFHVFDGYSSYIYPAKRCLYHVTGWNWVVTLFMCSKTLLTKPFNSDSLYFLFLFLSEV